MNGPGPPDRAGAGRFITLEGVSGAGKTTQARRLAAELRRQGRRVVVTRDPGGTRAGEAIRRLLLEQDEPLCPEAEIALFFADRAQNLAEVIRPALARGEIVLGDRFTDSTLAYQGHARGLAPDRILAVDRGVTGGFRPDLTLVLDLPAGIGLGRLARRDRIEREEVRFHDQVRAGFLALAEEEPDRVRVIDAGVPPDAVFAEVRRLVEARLRGRGAA